MSSDVHEARHKPGAWLEGRASLGISAGRPDSGVGGSGVGGANGSGANSRQRHRRHPVRQRHRRQPPIWNSAETSPMALAPLGNPWQPEQRDSRGLIGTLRIESLTSEDNGSYSCRVEFRKARSRIQEWQVRVVGKCPRPNLTGYIPVEKLNSIPADTLTRPHPSTVPPNKPTIRELAVDTNPSNWNSRPRKETQVFGPFNEGAKLVLECETSGGFPEPILTWWRDGRLVDDSFELVSGQESQVIQEFSLGHSNSIGLTSDEFRRRLSLESEPSEHSQHSEGGQVRRNRQPGSLIRNRLELGGLSRADLLANYSCQAWNSRINWPPPSASAVIDMNRKSQQEASQIHQSVVLPEQSITRFPVFLSLLGLGFSRRTIPRPPSK